MQTFTERELSGCVLGLTAAGIPPAQPERVHGGISEGTHDTSPRELHAPMSVAILGPGMWTIADTARPDLAPVRPRQQTTPRFRGDIEGLRAVAVLLVVAFHAGIDLVSGGFVGVDVFFVLSGFLITGLLVDEVGRTGSISIRDFYARRVRRLLPLSTLVLVATAVASFVLVPAIDRKGVAGDLAGAALWGANWRFAAQSTQYMADTDKSPVLHYWSLSVEEQFYVLWPLLLLVLVGSSKVGRHARPVVRRRIGLVLTVVVGLSLWASWHQTGDGSPFAYFGLHTRAWELGVGAGLAMLRPALPTMTRRAARAAGVLGVAMVVGSALVMDELTPFPGTAALVPVLGTALLVAAGARLPEGGVATALSHPVLRFIGRVSYSWYLWHWPVLVLANASWGHTSGVADGASAPRAPWTVVLVAVIVSFALAVASHYAVEQPLRQAAFLKVSRSRSLRAGGVLIVTSLVASMAVFTSSFFTSEQDAVASPVAATDGARQQALVSRSEAAALGPRTPSDARADEPRGGACYVGFEGTTVPPAAACRVGPASGGPLTIALVGDSHAHAWRPAFERLAKEKGWTVYFFAKSACTISDVPVWSRSLKARYDTCDAWRDIVLERLASIKDLDAVIIGRYPWFKTTALHPDGSKSTPATIGPLWTAASKRTFERLSSTTGRVIVLHDVPWPGRDVPSCLAEHIKDPAACSFDRDTRSVLDAPLLDAEKAAAPDMVRLVSLTDVICPEPRCQVVTTQGQIKFRDNSHLSAGYSTALWRPLAERLEAAIG